MRITIGCRLSLVVLAALCLSGVKTIGNTPVPWALRNVYSFTVGACRLDYAEENGAWRIREISKKGKSSGAEAEALTLLDKAGFSVVLGDGRSFSADNLKGTGCERAPIQDLLGAGTRYTVKFEPVEGLYIEHQTVSYKDWPFILMTVHVRNDSEKPIQVRKLMPVMITAGGIRHRGIPLQVLERGLRMEQGTAMFKNLAPYAFTTFYEPKDKLAMAIGVLSTGLSTPDVSFRKMDETYHGGVTSRYSAATEIQPGEILVSDPAFICFGLNPTRRMDEFYTWACSKFHAASHGR